MPMYLFKTADGEIVEEFFSMAEAPSIGLEVKLRDVILIRLASTTRLSSTDTLRKFQKYPYVSHSLPILTKPIGVKTEFDHVGRPIIRSQRHEANIAAAYNLIKL